jgi:hypothetical protein
VAAPASRKRKATKPVAPESADSANSDAPLSTKKPAKKPKSAKNVKKEVDGSDESDDAPLSSKKPAPKRSRKSKAADDGSDDYESEDDKPLAKAKAKKKEEKDSGDKPKKKKKQPKPEPRSSEDEKPLANGKATPKKPSAAAKRKSMKEESATPSKNGMKGEDEEGGMNAEEAEEYKWWLEEQQDGTKKWTTLEHNGVLFPPAYEPHRVKMKYDGASSVASRLDSNAQELTWRKQAKISPSHQSPRKWPAFSARCSRRTMPRTPHSPPISSATFKPSWLSILPCVPPPSLALPLCGKLTLVVAAVIYIEGERPDQGL